MSSINTQQLLEPVSLDQPAGENLEYDPLAMELETVSQGKPEQQMGDHIIPAEEPDWRQVQKLCLELLKRTRDLRLVAKLARASLRTQGFPAFRDCLRVMHGYLSDFWDDVHPQLDPDDDNDPMFRVNTISGLSDLESMLELLDRTELVAAQGIGKFSYRDIQIAQGERQPASGETAADRGLIDAAFMACDLERLQEQHTALQEAAQLARQIEATLTEKVGAGQACSLEPLEKRLREITRAVQEGLGKRGVAVAGEAPPEETVTAAAGSAASGGAAPAAGLNGAVQTRQDVVKAIDKILDYYGTHEPSSPIPLLLKGAKRMATMTFLEIVHDVTPDGLEHLKTIAGITDESQE